MVFPIDRKRSIGQAAKEIGVPEHVIRFWGNQFPDIKPTIGSGNRRYFYDRDIKILKKIKHYLYEEGYTIKGLQKLFRDEFFNLEEEKTGNEEKNIIKKNEKNTGDDGITISGNFDRNYTDNVRYVVDNNNTKIKEKLKVLKVKLNIFYEKLKSI